MVSHPVVSTHLMEGVVWQWYMSLGNMYRTSGIKHANDHFDYVNDFIWMTSTKGIVDPVLESLW